MDEGKFYIKVKSGVVTLLTKSSETVVEEWPERTLTEEDKLQFNKDTKTFTVGNTPGAALPSTGGPGTWLFTTIGNLMICLACVLLCRKQRLM